MGSMQDLVSLENYPQKENMSLMLLCEKLEITMLDTVAHEAAKCNKHLKIIKHLNSLH